ncbi:MAG TPA: gentisate 1,2-dioxygenase, partial [Terriglobia bacterium]|nr:gentisate 1,2-dioxygenase [Terriglobia bacterium]
MRRRGAPDPCQGYKNEYVNAWTGARPMFTIAAFLQLLPKGFNGATYRSTDATVYCCAEGGGKSRVGESLFEWGERDIFVVPSWAPVAHSVAVDTVLFSFSDRPAQEALGLWRERAD